MRRLATTSDEKCGLEGGEMRKLFAIITVLQMGGVLAQDPTPDLLERFLVRPDLIMRHQRALQLTEEQKEFMIEEVQRAQSEFTSLQWKLQGAVEKLATLMKEPETNDDELLVQLDQVLDLERKIKRAHLILAVRIKRKLTKEQVFRLERLRRQQRNRRDQNRRRFQRRTDRRP